MFVVDTTIHFQDTGILLTINANLINLLYKTILEYVSFNRT